jgi:PhnB protein
MRFGDMPADPDMPPLSESAKNMVMHMSLDIFDGAHTLMGSDAPEEMGFKVNNGNNVYIMLQTDTRAQARQLFNSLSEGGIIEQELQDMFWGDYYGSLSDKYGVMWMFICEEKA